MQKSKLLTSLLLTFVLIISQVAVVFAAPTVNTADFIVGTVQSITLDIDPSTGVITVVVDLVHKNKSQVIRVGLEEAIELGLVVLDVDGNPAINEDALGQEIEIEAADVIPDEEDKQHPVGDALAAFFSDIEGLDYDAIMSAHEDGNGFGLIAQALWLTQKLGGTAEDFALILSAKANKDFSDFVFEDGTSPTSWGQFVKAVLNGEKKGNLGLIMSNKDKEKEDKGNGNDDNGNNGNNKDKEEKDKSNNGKDKDNGKKP